MTAVTRFVPLDNLSLLEGSKLATISVHDDRIYLHLQDDDGADGRSFTFEQFYQALHGLLKPVVAPTPSSDDKSPTAATGEANSGTQEASEMHRWNWDRVHGEWFVCESHHSKSSGCEWRPATPEEISVAGKEPNDP